MKTYFFFLILLIFLFIPFGTQGAELYFGAPAKEVGLNQQFEVGVFLNTDGQEVNAFEGLIEFPTEFLEVQEVRDGGTIASFWIERPKKDNLFFSGIVPGGYTGDRGYLFSLIFTAQQTGEAVISTKQERILLHDGKGSAAEFRSSPLVLAIVKETSLLGYIAPEDAAPPEAFTPAITRDPNVFDDNWFLVFATHDKTSGLDHYEVKEQREHGIWRLRFSIANWEERESPYVLKDQKRKSAILIKAVDKQGNERIERVDAQNPLAWYENYFVWVIVGGGIFVLLFLSILWVKKKRKGK